MVTVSPTLLRAFLEHIEHLILLAKFTDFLEAGCEVRHVSQIDLN
jgi:hypothetical protein